MNTIITLLIGYKHDVLKKNNLYVMMLMKTMTALAKNPGDATMCSIKFLFAWIIIIFIHIEILLMQKHSVLSK